MSGTSTQVALVTGANRGIGFEVCRQLASRGFVVFVSARDAAKAKMAAAKLKTAGVVEPLALDAANARSINDAAAEVEQRHGRLDVLINNAGINYDTWETAENADIDGTVMETIVTNLLGPSRVCQAFLPLLRKSRAGRIVNVSTESAGEPAVFPSRRCQRQRAAGLYSRRSHSGCGAQGRHPRDADTPRD